MRARLIILGLLLSVLSYGQMIGMMGSSGSTGESWDTTGIFSDGNTIGWYIADVANYTTVGDTVISQWNDLSGNGSHLLQATPADRPKYAGDSVWFDGADVGIRTDDDHPDTTTVYMVMQQLTFSSGATLFRLDGGSFRMGNGTTNVRSQMGATYINITGAWGLGKRYLWTGEFEESGTMSLQINDGTPSTNTGGTMSSSYITVGESSSAVFSVSEIIVRHGIDSSDDQDNIRGYLNSKYSLY